MQQLNDILADEISVRDAARRVCARSIGFPRHKSPEGYDLHMSRQVTQLLMICAKEEAIGFGGARGADVARLLGAAIEYWRFSPGGTQEADDRAYEAARAIARIGSYLANEFEEGEVSVEAVERADEADQSAGVL